MARKKSEPQAAVMLVEEAEESVGNSKKVDPDTDGCGISIKSDPFQVIVARVLEGDGVSRAVSYRGFVNGKVPEPGFVIGDSKGLYPTMYVRDSDLVAATKKRERKKKFGYEVAKSWTGVK